MGRVKTMSARRFKRLSLEEQVAAVPFRARVGVLGWLLPLVIVAVSVAVMVYALFISDAGTTPTFRVYKSLMWIALPLSVFCLVPFVVGVFYPRHLTVTEEGLSTRSWRVRWDQVLSMGYVHAPAQSAVKASFRVPEEVWESGLREANRWDSGRPFGAGGLTSPVPAVRTQPNVRPYVSDMSDLFQVLHRRAWEQAGHTGGYHDGSPRMPDGRRAVAPNTAAEDDAS